MPYTSVFSGNLIYPSQVSYLALTLTEDVVLQWPLEAAPGPDVVARIIDVTPTAPSLSIVMPDATQTAPGQTTMYFNAGATAFVVTDITGGTLLSVSPGTTWAVYLTDNTTPAGMWRTFQYGSVTSQAQASALAGLGIVAQGSLLSQSQPVVTFTSDYTAGVSDRASAYVWTGALGTLTLSAASVLGNNWFMSIRNSGSGNLTITPSGADIINGASTVVLRPGDSATVNCDGTSFYTVGLGQNPVFAFDYTSIDLTGLSGTYTLSGSELNRISYDFVGALAGNIEIIVPATTQQYWVANDTTGGSFTLGIGTAAQSIPVNIVRGARSILYCNGSNVVNADTASIAVPIGISQGGTGATTASGARINLGGTTVGIGVFTAASAAAARSAIGAAASGVNSDITELDGLTSPLSATAASGPLTANALGYMGAPINLQNTAYTLLLTDEGLTVYHTSATAHAYTIPPNSSVAFPVGTVILIDNEVGGGVLTVTRGAGVGLFWRGNSVTSADRSLAANGTCAIKQVATDVWTISGSGLT